MGADAHEEPEQVSSRKSSAAAPRRVMVNISSGIYSDDEDAGPHDTRKPSPIGQVLLM